MPISAAERFQIAPTGRQQEAAQLGNPLVLVVFFWRGKCAKIINPPWNTTPGAQIEDPQAGLRYFFSGNKNMANRIYPAQLPAAASTGKFKDTVDFNHSRTHWFHRSTHCLGCRQQWSRRWPAVQEWVTSGRTLWRV